MVISENLLGRFAKLQKATIASSFLSVRLSISLSVRIKENRLPLADFHENSYSEIFENTGLFKMIVGVLTTCQTQLT